MDAEIGIENLILARDALTALNVRYFLMDGTGPVYKAGRWGDHGRRSRCGDRNGMSDLLAELRSKWEEALASGTSGREWRAIGLSTALDRPWKAKRMTIIASLRRQVGNFRKPSGAPGA